MPPQHTQPALTERPKMVPIGLFSNDRTDRTAQSTVHGQLGHGEEMFPYDSVSDVGRTSSPTDFISRRRPANNEPERDAIKRLRPTPSLGGNPPGNDYSSTTYSATGLLLSSPDSFSTFSSGNTPIPVSQTPGMLPNRRNPYDAPFPGGPDSSWRQFQDESLGFPRSQTSPPTPSFMMPSPSAQVAVADTTPFPEDMPDCADTYGRESCTLYGGYSPWGLSSASDDLTAGGGMLGSGSHRGVPVTAPQTGSYQGLVFTNQPSALRGSEIQAQAQHWYPQSHGLDGCGSAIALSPVVAEHLQGRPSGSLAASSNHTSHSNGAIMADIDWRTDPRPSPNPVSAASLQNILHPVDQTPTLKHLDLPPMTAISRPVILPKLPGLFDEGNRGTTVQAINSPKTRRPRSAFPPDLRDETNLTRAIGACLRCRSQRVRCVASAKGPNYPCRTCERVTRSSKKVIHDFCCIRIKFGGPSAYRVGGLQLTTRWKGVEVCDVPPEADSRVEEIDVKIYYSSHMHRYDLCDTPARLRVRRFTPKTGDVLARKWTEQTVDRDGVATVKRLYVELPPYALENTRQTCDVMAVYFEKNAVQAMVNTAIHSTRVIGDHMLAAVKHYQSLPDDSVEKDFLHNFFLLWFYNRFTMGSAYICSENKLGCVPVTDPSYPLGDRISLPRMITAQFDSIMATRFIQPTAKKVNAKFEKFFLSGNPEYWFTLYVCTFIMLAEVSFSCQDRRRHAIENWTSKRYTVAKSVINIQIGGMTALCHWLYYRTVDPTQEGWDLFCEVVNQYSMPKPKVPFSRGKRNKKACLTHEQFSMVRGYWQEMADYGVLMSTKPYDTAYENPLFFVSQMYPKGRKKVMWNYKTPRKASERGAQSGQEEVTDDELDDCFMQGLSDNDDVDEDVCSHKVVVTDVCFRCLGQSA